MPKSIRFTTNKPLTFIAGDWQGLENKHELAYSYGRMYRMYTSCNYWWHYVLPLAARLCTLWGSYLFGCLKYCMSGVNVNRRSELSSLRNNYTLLSFSHKNVRKQSHEKYYFVGFCNMPILCCRGKSEVPTSRKARWWWCSLWHEPGSHRHWCRSWW